MDSEIIFFYDGECPFCSYFAELIELKSGLSNIQIKNARENLADLPNGYDMDVNGAILIKDGQSFFGASAINVVCSYIEEPSDALLLILRTVFKSNKRSKALFPLLIWARRTLLVFKGVPRKFNHKIK